jgi:hypothetical protein
MSFFATYKKLILALGFIGLVIILGFAIYKLFFQELISPSQPQSITSTSTTTGLPQAGNGGTRQVVNDNNAGVLQTIPGAGNQQPTTPTVDQVANGGLTKTTDITNSRSFAISNGTNGNIKYYNPEDGKFYKLDASDQPVALSDQTFYHVTNVNWSPTKDKAILQYPDGSKTIYDFTKNKQITLPEHWQDFSFSPDGNNIALKSLGNDPDNRWLVTMNEDGGSVKALEQIGNPASVQVDWSPNQQIVAMYTNSTGIDQQEIYFVGLNHENLKSTVIEGRDLREQWSPTGDRLLYSVYSDKTNLKPSLWIVDAQSDNIGNNRQPLNLQTWADKCAFSDNTTAYCAVPNSLEEGAGMFPTMAANTPDTIYRINTITGAKEQIAIPEGNHTITELTVSKTGNELYFNDSNSGHMYKIDLK